jgi:hypothetical protein
MIVGQNSLLNQYVVTFYIKNLSDGQGLIYDSVRKAFVNTNLAGGTGGANRLGELLNVADSVDDIFSVQNGQALVYNSSTELWENQFIDYNDIANAPFVSVPKNELVFGDSSGGFTSNSLLTFDPATNILKTEILDSPSIVTQLLSSVTSLNFRTGGIIRLTVNSNGSISVAGSTGTQGQVLTSNGAGQSPTWQPSTGGGGGGSGTVTTVTATGTQGVTTNVTNPTTIPNIAIGLGAISPSSVTTGGTISAGGNITGLNLSGTNTGNQIIALSGDATGTSTGAPNTTLPLTLATVNPNVGSFGSASNIPVITVDGKGRITAVSTVTIGSVTSISIIGNNGITVLGSPITSNGTINLGLGNISTTGTISGSNITGTNTGNQTITATGDVTGVSTGAPATSLPLTLSTTGVTANTYGSATQVPQFTVDAKGRISNASNITLSGISSVETVVFHYSSGSAGNFTPLDTIFSKTSGVTVTVIDGANCIATYTFTGKFNPPKSITFYGQNFSTNKFSVSGLPGPNAAQANINLDGGGTPASPSIVNGVFTSANVLTLQTTMSFVGASSTLGNRAWLVIVFGF